ncbi:MAG: GNAT family N-acetyltransferase, partial [Parabacteroides sp.]
MICKKDTDSIIQIADYSPIFYHDFYRLNCAWIGEQWKLEPRDYEEMESLQEGIEGGFILIALYEGRPVGTLAMLPMDGRTYDYELAKFTTERSLRGLGIGRRLLEEAVRRADSEGKGRIYIITNALCHAAIHLYEAFGFRKLPGVSPLFERGDYL